MITGALAASYYGIPRTTMDIDVVAYVSSKNLQTKLLAPLRKAGFQVDVEKVQKALSSGYRILTFRDGKTPFSLDVMFSEKKFEKRAGTILGLPTFYQKPEDLILSKLRMIKATVPKERAIKDEDDIRAILKYTKVSIKVLEREARKEKTLTILENIMNTEEL